MKPYIPIYFKLTIQVNSDLCTTRYNKISLVQIFSKFGVGCPYYLLFFENLLIISVKNLYFEGFVVFVDTS